jgi:hypothetical protein
MNRRLALPQPVWLASQTVGRGAGLGVSKPLMARQRAIRDSDIVISARTNLHYPTEK